jgi:cytochrome c oxidase subunit 1
MYTTNHKDIGTMYLWFSCFMFFLGGSMAIGDPPRALPAGTAVRRSAVLQLAHHDPRAGDDLRRDHAGLRGLRELAGAAADRRGGHGLPAHEQLELLAADPGRDPLVGSFLAPGGAIASGWTLYPPLSVQQGMSIDMTIFAIHILGASSIMGSINIITTILNMRAPGMTLMKMPLFVWTWLITAYLLIAVMPVLAGAVTMLLTDRHFGTSFFNAAGGGDPTMFLHIFWFFGHPEVYIMILPAFGIVSQILPAFARKPLFGYASMVYATASIAILSFIVWGHHMFTVGMPAAGNLFFMYATMLIAVPTGVKVFNWISTMWKGSMTFETPMLFAIGFLCLFTIGGFSGLVLAIVPVDITLHNTYYVVAHFHYVLVSGALFAIIGGVYFWLPKWSGRMYNEGLGKLHFWLSMIGFNVALLPAALPGPRGHAAAHPGLRAAVLGMEHVVVDRRLHLRPVAAASSCST